MSKVYINGRSVLHKGDGQTQTCPAPDVCKTPSPGGPVPVPYVNVAQDSNLEQGTKSVQIDGNPVALSSSKLSTSSGNEGGTAGGGLISSKVKGTVTWASSSIDVKIEGKGVVRFLDVCIHNGNSGNTGGNPVLGNAATGMPSESLTYGADEKCPICGKLHELKSDELSESRAQELYKRSLPKMVDGEPKGYMAGVLRCHPPGGAQDAYFQMHSGGMPPKEFPVRPSPPSPMQWRTVGGRRLIVKKAPNFKGNEPGNCAAQKLISEAIQRGYTIKSMTEFWVGPTNSEGRKDGRHYESCSTCKQILPALLCPKPPEHPDEPFTIVIRSSK